MNRLKQVSAFLQENKSFPFSLEWYVPDSSFSYDAADCQAGTAIGLVVGMVVWYIGAPGLGDGNPYGIAAATVSASSYQHR